jgi:hypothetical protein
MQIEAEIKTLKFLRGMGRGLTMKSKLILLGALASLVFSSSSRCEELASSSSTSNSATLTSKISCNGNLSVPMTADQEQTLPMQLVADLECGEEVAVLSDVEGYTVHIRTEEGKQGHVAHMYLTQPVRKRPDAQIPGDNAAISNGVARWQAGAKGSYQFMNGSQLVESLAANSVTVQVSLEDTGWKMRANVAVVNGGTQSVYVLPKLLALDEIAPLLKPLRYQDPAQLAKAANHQVLWTSASAGAAGEAQSSRSYSSPNGDVYVLTYKLPVSDPSPNYLAQHQALETIAAKNQTALVNMVREINELSLRECTLKPSEKTAGAVWFERDAKSRQLILKVPVGEVIYEFPLSFNHDK